MIPYNAIYVHKLTNQVWLDTWRTALMRYHRQSQNKVEWPCISIRKGIEMHPIWGVSCNNANEMDHMHLNTCLAGTYVMVINKLITAPTVWERAEASFLTLYVRPCLDCKFLQSGHCSTFCLYLTNFVWSWTNWTQKIRLVIYNQTVQLVTFFTYI